MKMKEYQKVRDVFSNCPGCGVVNENSMEAEDCLICYNCHCVYDDCDLKTAKLRVPKKDYKRLSRRRIARIKELFQKVEQIDLGG
jgi:hypothetical protein